MKKTLFLLFMGLLVTILVLIPAINAFSDTACVCEDECIAPPEITVTSSVTDADTYEPDDTYDQAGVIVLNSPDVQSHNFHHAGDQDWVKFYALSGEIYSIEAFNVTADADVVIYLYDTDGTTLLCIRDVGWEGGGELLEFTSQSDGVYYVMVRNYYDDLELADNLAYELRVYIPIGPGAGTIMGTVYDSSNNSPIWDALIKTDLGASAISIEGGYYYMIAVDGKHTISCSHEGYQNYADGGISVSGDTVKQDIYMTSTGTQTCTNYLSSSGQSFDSSGGTGTVSVIAPEGCSWTAVSNDGWITIDSGSSGNGQATVSYTVAVNTDASSHTGTMTIAGGTFTVTQTVRIKPIPNIMVNNLEGPVNIITGDQLLIAIGLDPGSYSGASADWYIVVNTPSGWQSFNISQMDYSTSGLSALVQNFGLISFGPAEIFSTSSLSTGTYTYYFAVYMNGQLYYDSVVVNVQ